MYDVGRIMPVGCGVTLYVIAHESVCPEGLKNSSRSVQRSSVNIEQGEPYFGGVELAGQWNSQRRERPAPGVKYLYRGVWEPPLCFEYRGMYAPQKFRGSAVVKYAAGGVHGGEGFPARKSGLMRIIRVI